MVENTPTPVAKPSSPVRDCFGLCLGWGGGAVYTKTHFLRINQVIRLPNQTSIWFLQETIMTGSAIVTQPKQPAVKWVCAACRSRGAVRRLSDRLVVSPQLGVQLGSAEKSTGARTAETSLRKETDVATAFLAWRPTEKCVKAHACVCICAQFS